MPGAVVTPVAYVSLEQVPRGHTVDVALMLNITSGYHINSHTPSQSYLIATNVTLADTSGFQPAGSNYPAGQTIKFSFSEDKLSVYSGSATIWLRFQAQNDAPLGEITLPIVVRYQACNATACLPAGKASRPGSRLHSHSRNKNASQPSRNFQKRTQALTYRWRPAGVLDLHCTPIKSLILLRSPDFLSTETLTAESATKRNMNYRP